VAEIALDQTMALEERDAIMPVIAKFLSASGTKRTFAFVLIKVRF
jgi:hypothetical protein